MFKQVMQGLCFLSLLTPFASVHAEDRVPESLTLIGKGIANKAQGSMIAVACTHQAAGECSEIRIVEFVNQTPHWLSKPYMVPDVAGFLKDVKSRYRDSNRINMSVHVDSKTGSSFFYYGSMVVLAGSIAYLGTLTGVTVATAVLVFGGPATTFFVLMAVTQGNVDVLGGTLTVLLSPVRGVGNAFHSAQVSNLSSTDGWNWAVKPKYIGLKKYEKVKAILASTITDGKYARAETSEEFEARLEKVRIDLEERRLNKIEHDNAIAKNEITKEYFPIYSSSVNFSTENSEAHVCAALGYSGGLMDSAKLSASKYYADSYEKNLELIVDAHGEPVKAVIQSNKTHATYKEVTCFGKQKDTKDKRAKLILLRYPRLSGFEEYYSVQNGVLTPDAFCKYLGKSKSLGSGAIIEEIHQSKYAIATSSMADGGFAMRTDPSGWYEINKPRSAMVYTSLMCLGQ